MTDEPRTCPSCGTNLDGELIWDTFYEKARKGELYGQTGPAVSKLEAAALADKTAAMYGAKQGEGRWGRQIAIYSMDRDCTYAYQCPDCNHEWRRR